MKTVKQILENLDLKEYASEEFQKMDILSKEGLFEESRLPILNNALNKDPDDWTDAEKRIVAESLKTVVNTLVVEDVNSFMKKNVEKNIPVVIVLRRKAIRAFPDNQKIALYYSQALDKHVSIPFGPNNDALGIHLDEMASPDVPGYTGSDSNYPIGGNDPTNPPDAIKARISRIRKQKRKSKNKDGIFIDSPIDDIESNKPNVSVVPFQARITPSKIASKDERLLRNTDGPITNSRLSMLSRGTAKEVYKNELKQHTSGLPLSDRLAIRLGSSLSQGIQRGIRAIGNIGKTPMQKAGIRKIRISRRPISEEGIIDRIGKGVANGTAGALRLGSKAASIVGDRVGSVIDNTLPGKAFRAAGGPPAKTAVKKAWEKRNEIAATLKKGAIGAGVLGTALALSDMDRKFTDGSAHAFTGPGRKDLTNISKSDTDPAAQKGTQVSRAPVDAALAKRVWGSQTTPSRYAVGESVNNLSVLKTIVESNSPNNIEFGDNSISINKNIAQKILGVYESVNKKNKKKIERMLNENYDSFKEVLNFSIRQ